MTDTSSSQDLHPKHGGRFVLVRTAPSEDAGSPPEYDVYVYLAGGDTLRGRLSWIESRATLVPPLPDPWAHDEALKLARVLRQSAKERLSRWRPRD